jgi:hypothetical protein
MEESPMKALYEKGNMKSVGRRFAGVEGKTVKFIESSLGIDEEPHVYVQFRDGTALDIAIESSPNLTAGWLRVKAGNQSPLRRRIFI